MTLVTGPVQEHQCIDQDRLRSEYGLVGWGLNITIASVNHLNGRENAYLHERRAAASARSHDSPWIFTMRGPWPPGSRLVSQEFCASSWRQGL